MMDINTVAKFASIDNVIKTLNIEELCDCAIGMLECGYATTDDIINVIELIKDRAKLLRE